MGTSKKKQKQTHNLPFDVKEFGKRVTMVRQRILRLTQQELVPLLNTNQASLSRLESGIGGNIHAVFVIVDYLNNNGYEGHMLFKKDFDISLFAAEIKPSVKKELIHEIELLQKQTHEKISAIRSLIG